MNRREVLRTLAAFGIAVPVAALSATASARVVDAALRRLDGTPWWLPVLQAWRDGRSSPELDALCVALEVPTVYDCAPIDVAVARLLLGGIQDELPAWRTLGAEGWTSARPPFPRHRDRTPVFRPTLALAINWANSGPGLDWPEVYHVTHVPELGIYVVTASRDSEDAFGVTDHAIGHQPDSLCAEEAASALIESDWRWRRDAFEQGAWEEEGGSGLIQSEAAGIRAEVWFEGSEDEG